MLVQSVDRQSRILFALSRLQFACFSHRWEFFRRDEFYFASEPMRCVIATTLVLRGSAFKIVGRTDVVSLRPVKCKPKPYVGELGRPGLEPGTNALKGAALPIEQPRKLSGLVLSEKSSKEIRSNGVGSSIGRAAPKTFGVGSGREIELKKFDQTGSVAQSVEQPRKLSGLVLGEKSSKEIRSNGVGSSIGRAAPKTFGVGSAREIELKKFDQTGSVAQLLSSRKLSGLVPGETSSKEIRSNAGR